MWKLARLAAVGVLALWLANPAAGQGPPYPVWWSSALELDSLDAIDARLERELWKGDGEGLPLGRREGDAWQEVRARSCNDLKRLTEAGYDGIGTPGYRAQLYNLAYCRAIEWL